MIHLLVGSGFTGSGALPRKDDRKHGEQQKCVILLATADTSPEIMIIVSKMIIYS